MGFEALVMVFPNWGTLPRTRVEGNARLGRPYKRREAPEGSILARRLALGLTQEAVAGRLGICAQTLRRLEARPRHLRGVRSDVFRLRNRVTELYRRLEREREGT
jgi:hypothetical protein